MKKYYLSLFVALAFISACGSASKTAQLKQGSSSDSRPYPILNGYTVNSFSVPGNKSDAEKSKMKIEIVAGKTMEVDCNHHFLTGNFEKKTMDDGDVYYIFESTGNVASTMMACLDNSTQTQFVKGKGVMLDYDDRAPTIVYTPQGIDARHRIWESSTDYPVSQPINLTIESEVTKALQAFPDSLKGYDRYVLVLPEIQQSKKDVQIEIIPGVTAQTDCNRHRLLGNFREVNVEGWGYRYLVFDSQGDYVSTRMACPGNALKSEFVMGNTRFLDYNSRLPIVIFVPRDKGFSVRYRVWESPKFTD